MTVSLTAADGGGGLGTTRYTLDGTDPTPASAQYTAPFVLTNATTVKFRTWDLAGNAELVRTQQINLDTDAPAAAISSPADGSNVQGDVTIDVAATDTGSGISDAELYLDGDWKAYTATAPYKFTLPASTLALGQHRIKVMAYDNLGNVTTTPQVTFSLKDGLPETSIACNSAACSPDWQKGPVSVSLSAVNTGTGGIGATRYTLDGTDPGTSSPQYTAPFTLTDSTTVKFRTWDTTGTAETVKTQALKIDAVAPTAQISAPADNGDLLRTEATTVKVDASDAGSGVNEVDLLVDGDDFASSSSTSSPYEVTIPANALPLGKHTLKAVVLDALGNRTSSAPVTVNAKDGLPETTIACDGAACPTDFVKGPVSVSLTAANGGGGLGATRFTLDGTDPDTSSPIYTAPFTLSTSTTVKFRTWDTTGAAETVKTQALKVDAVGPTAQITAPADNADVQKAQANTVTVDASDSGSGVNEVDLLVDGDDFASSSSTSSPYDVTIPANALTLGQHKLKAIVIDALGNRTSTAITTINVKDGLPETTIACDNAACSPDFVKGPVSVSLTAADGGSGLGATRYTLDGSDPDTSSTTYSGPFTLTDTTTVKFRTWDGSGAGETTKSQTVKVDAVGPTAQITAPADNADVQKAQANTVTVDASDSGSGVNEVDLLVDGDDFASSSSTSSPYDVTIPANALTLGKHKLKAVVLDALGNRTSTAGSPSTSRTACPRRRSPATTQPARPTS